MHLDWTKTEINAVSVHYTFQRHVNKFLLYTKLYEPNLYNLEAKGKLDYEELNKIVSIMVTENTVLSKFDQALQIITLEDSEVLRKTTSPIYNCTLLFVETQGLINFSNGFQYFTYMDLCALECFVTQIVHLLILHYWILPENIDLQGECYLSFSWPGLYFISINGDNIQTSLGLWKRSNTQVGLVKPLLEILVDIMDKDDSYSQIMLGEAYYTFEDLVEGKRNGSPIPDFNTDSFEFDETLNY